MIPRELAASTTLQDFFVALFGEWARAAHPVVLGMLALPALCVLFGAILAAFTRALGVTPQDMALLLKKDRRPAVMCAATVVLSPVSLFLLLRALGRTWLVARRPQRERAP